MIFYVVTHPSNFKLRYGQVGTLAVMQDTKFSQLDRIWNDCIQIYPRPHQPTDPNKVVIRFTISLELYEFLVDQTGSENPFYDQYAVDMLDVYSQFFGSVGTLKICYPELWDLVMVEFKNQEGTVEVKQITKIDLDWEVQ